MLAHKKTATNIGVGLGLLLQIVGNIVVTLHPTGALYAVGLAVALVGLGVFVWGCWNYAQGKGYHGAVGLLGLLSCIGLLVLVLLPDKHR